MTQMSEKQQKAEEIAAKIWKLSQDKLLVNLRFLDVALAGIALQPSEFVKIIFLTYLVKI